MKRMTEETTIQGRIPTRAPDFLLEQLDDDVLLYHPGLTKTIRLNETAAALWKLCDGERSVGEIASMLVEAYPDDECQVAGDVEATLRVFAAEGAIELR